MNMTDNGATKYVPGTVEVIEVVSGFQVILLQAGLALLEAGTCRVKNVAAALMRQLGCLLLTITVYWVLGYAWAFGGSHVFIGWDHHFALSDTNVSSYSHFFIHAIVAATPSSILGGTIAERSHITGHFVICLIFSGLLYPIVCHWIWDNKGWLYAHNYQDIGGCLPVHVLAGSLCLTACLITGNRTEKLGNNFRTRVAAHSLPLSAIGGALIFVGMVGKATGLGSGQVTLGEVAMDCLIAASGGGSIAVFLYKLSVPSEPDSTRLETSQIKNIRMATRKWSFYYCFNGAFAGLVAVQGGAGLYHPWAAYVVGLVAGIIYFFVSRLHVVARLDDCTDAIAVHLGPGMWGNLAVPLLSAEGLSGSHHAMGVSLGWQAAGVATCIAWTCATAAIILYFLLLIGKLRIEGTVERLGADIFKIEEQAYSIPANYPCTNNNEVKGEGLFRDLKTPGLSPIAKRSQKPLLNAPSRNLNCTAVVSPCNLNAQLTSTKKVECYLLQDMNELSRSAPRIMVENADGGQPLPPPPPPPPFKTANVSVSSNTTLQNPGDETLTSQQSNINVQQLAMAKLAVKDQRGKLKAAGNLMRIPSTSLINRETDLNTSTGSCMSLKEDVLEEITANPANFNYLGGMVLTKKLGDQNETGCDETFKDTVESSDNEDDKDGGNEESCISSEGGDEQSCLNDESQLEVLSCQQTSPPLPLFSSKNDCLI